MIPVVWHAQKNGRGHYDSTSMLNDMLDTHDCQHFFWNVPPDVDGAVVVVHGCQQPGSIDRVNADIEPLRWCIVIVLGDEENSFPVEQIEHKNKRIWIQEPMPGRHEFCDRFMVNGYGHTCPKWIVKDWKDLNWFFGGQVTHERRRACVDVLRAMDWGGVILETKGFHQGLPYPDYIKLMCRAKIVPCPSGPFSQDAARPWDVLETGGIPILDEFSPTRKTPGFWKMVLGEHPLPMIKEWSELPALISELLKIWEERAIVCQNWWTGYKKGFCQWLEEDLHGLRS